MIDKALVIYLAGVLAVVLAIWLAAEVLIADE